MIPKNLTQEQKDNRKNICSDIMERITEQPDVLENVITCDETWIFQYDPEMKAIDALEDTHFPENEKKQE
jgi:hypothetical protein